MSTLRHAILLLLASLFLWCQPLPATAQQTSYLQKELVTLASKLRNGENRLAKLATQQANLDARITDARTQIDEGKDEIDGLLKSLIRLSRTPPEAVVAMPGELRHTLQAAQLMTQLTENLQSKTRRLSRTLKQLKEDEITLAETRARLQQQQARLVASRKALEKKLNTRTTRFRKDNERYAKQKKLTSQIKRKSRNVSQLVTKLEKKQTKPVKTPVISFGERRGKLPLPVAGRIIKRYGQKDGVDQTSHGYRVASAAGSTVVSPASGEVMFTGPFLDYGNIVIVRFDNGYHLLLAGLDKIDCSVGQKIVNGEPVGRLGANQYSGANLYMELRKNGKPIDPSPWFG